MNAQRLILQSAIAVCFVHSASAATAPEILDEGSAVNITRLPDGSNARFWANSNYVRMQQSFDQGSTWTAAQALFFTNASANPTPLVDQQGELHFVQLRGRDETGGATKQPNVNYFIDLYSNRSSNNRTTWSSLAPAFYGYCGSLMKVYQTRSGRIVVPFGNWIPYSTNTSPNGHSYTTAIYSDDNGTSWLKSPTDQYALTPSDWNGSPDGVCEPSIVQLNDDRLWMLMRNQTGKLLQAHSSNNGETWTANTPTNFYTTTGPTALQRLDDGRLMLFWNNGTMPARYNGSIWYAGRDALHAAISSDDGQTWHGFREIYLDPARNLNPILGDSGTAYPFVAPTNDGRVLVITGQADAHTMLRIDPNWLDETSQSENFTGANALDDWSVFKPFGDVVSVKRNRVQGPQLIDDPDPVVTNQVLQIRRPDTNDPDGAMWNFPMAKKGETQMRIKLQTGFAGGLVAFNDRFFNPTDTQGDSNAIFSLPITAAGALPSGTILQKNQWYNLQLNWDLATHQSTVLLDGVPVGTLSQLKQALPGASYLRLRSTAAAVDTAGFLIDDVSQVGLTTGAIKEATRYSASDAEARLAPAAGWTAFRFDDYVPNTGVSGTILANSGTFSGFVSPTTSATPVGVVLSSSTNTVTFSDSTSLQVTSDILGPNNGASLTIRFVDPTETARPAAVSGAAMRFGSTLASNVSIKLYDLNGNELPDYLLYLDATSTGAPVGFQSVSDLNAASLIHRIVLSGAGSDVWLLGSFGQSTSLYDFAFTGFTPAPRMPGDANYDGLVNSIDFGILAANYGKTSGATWSMADFDLNGKVNSVDFNILAGNFGASSAPSLGAVVPEPAHIACLLVLSQLLCTRRRCLIPTLRPSR
jgi:hypothetical protein